VAEFRVVPDDEFEELAAQFARDDWAYRVIARAGFLHVDAAPGCRGFTMLSGGRARCGACTWEMSAGLEDAATPAGGSFALFALGTFGAVVAACRQWSLDQQGPG
jgi:hypothetical protein